MILYQNKLKRRIKKKHCALFAGMRVRTYKNSLYSEKKKRSVCCCCCDHGVVCTLYVIIRV